MNIRASGFAHVKGEKVRRLPAGAGTAALSPLRSDRAPAAPDFGLGGWRSAAVEPAGDDVRSAVAAW